jgi:HD-like signal output (HDOD) protein
VPNFCQVEVPFETFTAALLHDVGKLVMARFLSPEILAHIRKARQLGGLSQTEAESLLLGVNHAELGGLVAQHWQLPPRLVQGILYHHDPEHGFDTICDLTCVADQVAKRIEAGLDGREFEPAIPVEVADRLGLTPAILDEFYPVAAARYAQVSCRYNAV